MLRRLLALLAVSILFAPAAAQDPAAEAAELERLLLWFLDGASRNDVAVHERFWSDELIYTRSAGVRTDKAEILAELRKGTDPSEPPTEYSAEDIRIRLYGDTAVVAFRLIGRVGGDAPETLRFLNTGTFLKRDGEWRAVAWQATREADTPAP
jgi:hypothetical protein